MEKHAETASVPEHNRTHLHLEWVRSVNRPSLTEVLEPPEKYDKSSKRWKEAVDTATFYLAKSKIPFKAVGR